MLLPLVLVGGGVALLLTWPEGLLQAPAAPTGAVGLALLAVASLLTWLDYQDDAITAPGGALRRSGRARIGSAVVMPGLTLVVVALAVLTHVLS